VALIRERDILVEKLKRISHGTDFCDDKQQSLLKVCGILMSGIGVGRPAHKLVGINYAKCGVHSVVYARLYRLIHPCAIGFDAKGHYFMFTSIAF